MASKNTKFAPRSSNFPSISRIIIFGASALLFSSCISIKSYRQAKSQMLYNEIELYQASTIIDSLNNRIEIIDKKLAVKDSIIGINKSENEKLKIRTKKLVEEYELLMEEFKEQEKQINETKKSTTKTKR